MDSKTAITKICPFLITKTERIIIDTYQVPMERRETTEELKTKCIGLNCMAWQNGNCCRLI